MVAEIRAFPTKAHAVLEVEKWPSYYGARAVKIKPNQPHPYQDSRGFVWVLKRDGEHFLRINGVWE